MGLTCNLLYSVLSVSLFYAAFTRANTDKLIFRGDVRHAFACSERINQWATPETTLQPPHKCVQMRQLSRDKQEHWYAIQALQDKMAYEIRISYPATVYSSLPSSKPKRLTHCAYSFLRILSCHGLMHAKSFLLYWTPVKPSIKIPTRLMDLFQWRACTLVLRTKMLSRQSPTI